ncbi:cytochrome P450 [Nocardia sp. NBC_01503]|uniref:cytochrome P450 n=1 Tax=Nocardia sp. NBC_01503 TaxID=2975997 RepID=UPI002E7AF210|nr:cytochrome P450 [Nocardia sp. NBC_01503]WTL34892.1 cytochrome P450 [Nocardia sp. NBC_01503]
MSSPARPIPRLGRPDGLDNALALRRDQLGFLSEGLARRGDVFEFSLLGLPMVLVNHPDHIRHILLDNSDGYDKNAVLFKIVRPVLRKGLIANADHELWQRQRRMIAPHLTPRAISGLARNMTAETERMLDRWDASDAPVLDITDQIGQLALRIVNRSLFSADVDTTALAFERAFGAANAILGEYFRFPFPPLSVPTRKHRRLRRAIADMDAFVSGFITERAARPPATGEAADLLTMLMHAVDEIDGRGMDIEQLHHEVLNICIGAYETTTNTLSWAFYLLARHPEVERRVHEEVDRVIGDRIPEFADIPRLPYLRMVIDETLRIYSPAYQFMRRALADDEIGGYRIRKGSNILINSYLLHRHPEFWEDPERFDPERFSAENIARRPKHAYIPFGSGHRVCVGKHFALTELVLVLATVAARYRLRLPNDAASIQPEALITLHPAGGVHLCPQRREGLVR